MEEQLTLNQLVESSNLFEPIKLHGDSTKNWNEINKLIQYSEDGILSRVIMNTDKMNITLFCMAKGTEISEHTTTKEGFVFVIEGEGTFYLQGEHVDMLLGIIIFMEKSAVHSLRAKESTSFILSLSS